MVQQRLHKQRRKNTCAVGALRTVLDLQFGIKVSEQALEAHATTATTPILKHGCGSPEIRLMVRGVSRTHNTRHATRPWTLRVSKYGSIAALVLELAAGRIPMVSVPGEEDNQHMLVVLAVQDERVKIWDPAGIGEPEWWGQDRFLSMWDEEGHQWYAVVGGA